MRKWSYSAAMLVLYLAVFRVWQSFPGRTMFLVSAGSTAGLMIGGMILAARRGYFANRRDLFLHALVILDVALEGGTYELVRIGSLRFFGATADIRSFHESHDFYVCATAFALLVGGYHGWAMRRRMVGADAQIAADVAATPD